MTIPVISIIATAARPENWQRFYDSVGQNDVPFEIVFVGPRPPVHDMPDNFVYVHSKVKPAQCVEIAARRASGELLLLAADDMIFSSPHPLDEVYKIYRETDDPMAIVSLTCEAVEGWNHFYEFDLETPIIPLSGTMAAQLWRDVGGVDRNFVSVYFDVDIAMRIFALGGRVVPSNVSVDTDVPMPDVPNSSGTILGGEFTAPDRTRLNELWTVDGRVHLTRALPFEPLDERDILVKSQHPRGRWRYNNDFINKLSVLVTRYKLRQWRSKTAGRLYRFLLRNNPSFITRILIRLRPGTRY
jgi:hypothetical protein